MGNCRDVTIIIITAVIILAVHAAILIGVSLNRLDSFEVGLKYNTATKSLSGKVISQGLYNGNPGFKIIKFDAVFRSMEFKNLQCLNRDGVQIKLIISFQYRVRVNKLHDLVMQFRDSDKYKDIVQSIAESAIHDACSKFNTSQFQAERGAFQVAVRSQLVSKLDDAETDVTDLQVNNIARPKEYEDAVTRKESARENIVVATNERPKKLTAADTERLAAETQASIAIAKAESDARIRETRATAEARAILEQYTKEAESYQELLAASGLNLTVEGFLRYLAVRIVEDSKNNMQINLAAPAKTAW